MTAFFKLLICSSLAFLVLAVPGLDEADSPVCDGSTGDACEVSSSKLLQAKASRQRSGASVGQEEETEAEEALEEQAAAWAAQGTRVENLKGARILIHNESDVAQTGTGQWLIIIPEGCTNEDVHQMAEHMPHGATADFEGSPDEGGLCTFVMTGTEEQVREELTTHTWPSPPIVESVVTWRFIDEIGTEEEDKDPALIQQANPPSWGIDRVDDRQGLDQDYSPTFTGKGIHVYVADTGIRTTHRDFGGRAIPTLEVLSSRRKVCSSSDTSCAFDKQGHGTHCAGTVGGASYGVAKEATLHAVKVLSDNGGGSFSWFVEAIDWVLTDGVKPAVFSASLGGKGVLDSVKTAIDSAVKGGVTVVVAAGNDGRSREPDACKYSPAYVPSAITVGSTQKGDSRSSFSSYGSCLDIYAPGSDIESAGHKTDSGQAKMSGTSMACPHVAGAMALIFEEDKTLSSTAALSRLLSRATKGVVRDAKPGSPTDLLYTGPVAPTPGAAPAPTPVAPKYKALSDRLKKLKEEVKDTEEEVQKVIR